MAEITAGVDIRTVAGRLGHGSGGVTTLRVYEKVAVSLREQILDGTLPAGLPIPPVKELAHQHGVSVGTVHRAVDLSRAGE